MELTDLTTLAYMAQYIPSLINYLLIGVVFLLILVFLIGFKGGSWSKTNLWIILAWPIELMNLIGTLTGLIYYSIRPPEEPQQPQPQHDPTKYRGE